MKLACPFCLFLLALTVSVATQQFTGPLPLAGVRIVATHETFGGKYPATNAMDGDEATFWAGDGHDLTALPTNLVVTLGQPTAVGSLEVLTQVLKRRLRLTDLEVYARVGDGWALLGAARSNEETRFVLNLEPAEVRQLRLRVLNTARPDHAWPRINEVRLYPPAAGAGLAAPRPTDVPNETVGERIFLADAMGLQTAVPRVEFDPDKGYLYYARSCVETLIADGTDRYGEVRSPMFVSVLDTSGHRHPNCQLPAIEGQRQGDRALFGGNLQHDIMLLRACEYMAQITGDGNYRDAARAYLQFFLDECTNTPSGLWPWGEHAHWDFYKEAPGHNTHEYLGAPPLDFWEFAWSLNSEAVLREANGLLDHVVNLENFDYNRHADITRPLPDPRPEGMGFFDFPRHGGFYIQAWAFAYSKTADEKYLNWCERMMDHHTSVRHPESGLIPVTSSQHPDLVSVATQLSLAISMLESVPLLSDTPTARRCDRLAHEYLQSLAALPHQPDKGLYCGRSPIAGPREQAANLLAEPGFAAHYGKAFLCMDALLWTQAYRLTGEPKYLDIALGPARFYATAEQVPAEEHTRAHIYGSLIDLMLDMNEIVSGNEWMPAAERYARQAIEELFHNGLLRGATSLWYYESELWPGTLVYALVRLQTVLDESPVRVKPNYFHR